ncbi:hypothetical protein D3C73_1532250 [compost metagenome]
MDITQDIKLCKEIVEQYNNLTSEDCVGAFRLSKIALIMYDRLSELRLYADKIELQGLNKTEKKEFLRAKMKVMDYIHVSARVIFTAANSDGSKFKRV